MFKSFLRDIKNYCFFAKNPFGKEISATKEYYLNKFEEARKKTYEKIDKILFIKNFDIDKFWLDNLALHTQVVKKKSQINYQHGRILYSFLRKYISENKISFINIVEIGTARGFSAVCMSKAINDENINGEIITIDIIPNDKSFFWNCIDDHEKPKTRYELLSKWQNELKNINFLTGPSRFVLKRIKANRIHFAFIDGMHDFENVKKEFNFISSRQKKNDIIIFDDVSESFPEVKIFMEHLKILNSYAIEVIHSDEFRSYAICIKLND